ncbi:MAG: hypothetical protein HY518_01870 [Candidatus Aenigmarchaeota archaeon]|nr:hypothetical protein [Candidatus Aenigmarchaeota archaeon]
MTGTKQPEYGGHSLKPLIYFVYLLSLFSLGGLSGTVLSMFFNKPPEPTPAPHPVSYVIHQVGDLNSDGISDLVVRLSEENRVVYVSQLDGTYVSLKSSLDKEQERIEGLLNER